ncbi:MAG: sigma-70 family RNA polymerase sigma factor [Myxococcales bacterium]|nr:sigma-70 family RNA polymerase sigma factor [Myxococcales bacterium]
MTKSSSGLEDLVADAAEGNEAAWWLLWEEVEPGLERLLKNPRVTGRLSTDIDDVRNILVGVIEKLRADNARRLKSYVESRGARDGGFEAWLVVVTKRVAIDYMRAHHDYVDHRRNPEATEAAGEWVIPKELPSDSQLVGNRPPVTTRGAALALLRYAYDSLPKDQMEALELWILNTPYSTIAEKTGMESAEHAQKRVRAGLERIRRRFRESTSGS